MFATNALYAADVIIKMIMAVWYIICELTVIRRCIDDRAVTKIARDIIPKL